MKTWFTNLFFMIIGSFVFFACEKDEEMVMATANGKAPALTASQTNLVLSDADKGKDAVTFSWTKADFGYKAAVEYSLEFGKKGASFQKGKLMEVGNASLKTFTVAQLNAIANELELTGFTNNEMEVRVKATITDTYTPIYSKTSIINITPYLSEPEFPVTYLVGAATEFGWDNTKATHMFRDEQDPFVYTYTGYFKAGEFKMLGYRGKWAPQWGKAANGSLAFRATEADPDPANYNVATAGYYTAKLDLRTGTFTMDPYDASAAVTHASIGIIGPFNNNWSFITPMTKTALNPHTWVLEHTFDADTEMKFRIAPDWTSNWGAGSDNTKTKLYDKGTGGGPNIMVKKGSYRIIFNDLTSHYVLIKL